MFWEPREEEQKLKGPPKQVAMLLPMLVGKAEAEQQSEPGQKRFQVEPTLWAEAARCPPA